MKKIIAMLMLAMVFIGLMPFATAIYREGASGAETDSRLRAEPTQTEGEPEPMLLRLGEREGNMTRQRLGEGQMLQLRKIAATRLQAARQRFESAKQKYENAKQNYAQAKTRIGEGKEKYKSCQNEETEECNNIKKETKTNAKNFLTNSADRIISSLEKLKERIEMSEGLSEEEAAERIAEIDAKIADLEASKGSLENLDEESTPEEIRGAANQIKNVWRNTQKSMKTNAAKVINAKIGGVIVKSEKLEERLDNAVEKLSEAGADITDAEALIEEFKAEIASAKEHYKLAMDKIEEARATEGAVDEIMKESTSHMKEAHKDLKEAHDVLRKVLKEIKQTKQGEEALEEAEEEELEGVE